MASEEPNLWCIQQRTDITKQLANVQKAEACATQMVTESLAKCVANVEKAEASATQQVTESLAKVENAMDTAITDANDLMTQFTVAMEPLSDTHRTIMQCLRMNIKAPPHPEFFAGVSGHSGVTYGIWTSLLDSNRDPR